MGKSRRSGIILTLTLKDKSPMYLLEGAAPAGWEQSRSWVEEEAGAMGTEENSGQKGRA